MSQPETIAAFVFGSYVVLTVGALAFRGMADALDNQQAAHHFVWPIFIVLAIACVPVGIGLLIGKAFKEGYRILKLR